ncbi:MAG: glycosyltransferase family 4 protein [Flavobacteriales bacterium]
MRILQICSKPSFPPVDGGTQAMHQLSEILLEQGVELKILCFETPKHPFQASQEGFLKRTNFECIKVDTRVKIMDMIANLFGKQSYHIQRFLNTNVEDRLKQLLAETAFDVIILDSLFSAAYYDTIRKKTNAKIYLRAHNVEYIIWENLARGAKNPIKKWYFNLLTKRLKSFEVHMINSVDGVLCISAVDLELYKQLKGQRRLYLISFASSKIAQRPSLLQQSHPSAYHLASMDWYPNVEAVQWFIKKVWPVLKEKNQKIEIHFAGRKMPDSLIKQSEPRLHIHSQVDDISYFLDAHTMLIVPLQSGSGIRIKIVEGLAMGKAIISTSKGAEGLGLKHGENILIADTPEEFAQAICDCAENIELHNKIAENALKFAAEKLSRQEIGKNLMAVLQIH